jgi:hypothetical protein
LPHATPVDGPAGIANENHLAVEEWWPTSHGSLGSYRQATVLGLPEVDMKESFLESEQALSSAVHARANSTTQRIVESPKPLPIVAEHPDAAPQRADTILRMIIHALVLVAIIAFLTYYCLWLPLRGKNAAALDPTQAEPAAIRMPNLLDQPH